MLPAKEGHPEALRAIKEEMMKYLKHFRMDHCNFDLQIKNVDDFSYPHKYEDGRYVKVPLR